MAPKLCCVPKAATTSSCIVEKLPLKQKLSFLSGHILNDLCGSAWYSYVLVFLTKIAGLSNPHAGYIVLAGQIMEAVSSPVIGQLCDRTVSNYGRRKTWHLLGTVLVSITFPMILMRCIGCEESSSATKLGYYISLALVFCIGWGSTQIGHLSLIPEICRKPSEAIELTALRSAVTFICGIFIYVVTWVLLGQNKEGSLSPKVWKQFMYLGVIVVAVGNAFNLVFHIWTIEPKNVSKKDSSADKSKDSLRLPTKEQGKALIEVTLRSKSDYEICETQGFSLSSFETTSCSEAIEITEKSPSNYEQKTCKDWLKDPQFYTTNLLYTCSRLVVNISQAYLPLYLTETLRFEKESIAYFPLIILITGVLSSPAVKPLNHHLGSKITYSIGCFIAIISCVWFYLQTIESRNAVYATAVIIGSGGSIMLSTSLSMIAELIGEHKTSGAFVYGTIGFTDKVSSGIVIAIIQQINPRKHGYREDCGPCDTFIRFVLSCTPGSAALVGLFLITFFFKSIFTCERRVKSKEIGTQTREESPMVEKRNNLPSIQLPKDHKKTLNRLSSSSLSSTRLKRYSQRLEHDLFEKRNFLSSSWWSLEGQAAVRLATYEKMSPKSLRRSLAV